MASHEHNLLPFGTPQSYPLLNAQSKAVSAANNKERLGECHDIYDNHCAISNFLHSIQITDFPTGGLDPTRTQEYSEYKYNKNTRRAKNIKLTTVG